MITLKDIIELRPCCKVRIDDNNRDFVEMCKFPEDYIVTDMVAFGSELVLKIGHKDDLV